ncbi:hypothetical protein D3C81_1783150 [compost metagenome]
MRALQSAQLRHLRTLNVAQALLFSEISGLHMRIFITAVISVEGTCHRRLEARNGFTQAIDLELETALRQLSQGLRPVTEQTQREIRPAGHGRTQRQAEAEGKQMTRPITGKHVSLLDQ